MSCPYYTFQSGLFGGDYWCKASDVRVDSGFYKIYCNGYRYNECPKYKEKAKSSGGCYLTTIVCQILNKEDNDKNLNTLRFFRDEVMQKEENYHNMLLDYDNIGPVLATYLATDEHNQELAKFLYDEIITPVAEDINNKKYEEAVTKYEIMTLSLINYYGLKNWYNDSRKENYGEEEFYPEVAGHGVRVRK